MTTPDLHDDDGLQAALRLALRRTDDVPAEAVDAAVAAFDIGHLDGELAEKLAREHELVVTIEENVLPGGFGAAVLEHLLRRALLASLPDVLAGLEGDERNTLLTLARTLVTLDSGRIVAKDEAAELIAPTLRGPDRALLLRTRDGYRGSTTDEWADAARVASLAHRLAERSRQRAGG